MSQSSNQSTHRSMLILQNGQQTAFFFSWCSIWCRYRSSSLKFYAKKSNPVKFQCSKTASTHIPRECLSAARSEARKRNRGASLGSGASTERRRDPVCAAIFRGHVQRRGNGVSHEEIKAKIKADVPLEINRHNIKGKFLLETVSCLAWNSSRMILPKSEEECLIYKEEPPNFKKRSLRSQEKLMRETSKIRHKEPSAAQLLPVPFLITTARKVELELSVFCIVLEFHWVSCVVYEKWNKIGWLIDWLARIYSLTTIYKLVCLSNAVLCTRILFFNIGLYSSPISPDRRKDQH